VVSLSPVGALGLLARIALAAVLSAAFLNVAIPSAARAQASETPPSQAEPKPEMREACPGLVAGDRPRVLPAALKIAALNADQVRLTFIGHSTFMIESPEGVRIATDYNDYLRLPVLPDIVTMNHAHETHFSDHPNPAIQYVLRGWGPSPQEPAIWDLKYRDVRVRNVPTNIRDWTGGTERYGNRSSSSRSRTCASPISAICITRSPSSSSTRSAARTWSWRRWTAISPSTSTA
jgi:hypothetical protein